MTFLSRHNLQGVSKAGSLIAPTLLGYSRLIGRNAPLPCGLYKSLHLMSRLIHAAQRGCSHCLAAKANPRLSYHWQGTKEAVQTSSAQLQNPEGVVMTDRRCELLLASRGRKVTKAHAFHSPKARDRPLALGVTSGSAFLKDEGERPQPCYMRTTLSLV